LELRGNSGERLAIDRADVGPPGTPGDRDLLLNVSVSVRGYSGNDQCWVTSADWEAFVAALKELERARKGTAVLRGASEEEFEVQFTVIDSSGHTGVSGFLVWRSSEQFSQRLEFGFPFDPGLLATTLRGFVALST
jgi:hypothetical protein